MWQGEVLVAADGSVVPLGSGSRTLNEPRALWHDGVAYVFPKPEDVRVELRSAEGSWSNITRQSWARSATVEVDRFTLWLNHGVDPHDAGYAYIVAPGIEAEDFDGYLADNPIRILANNAELQAVAHPGAGLYYAVFYEPGSVEWNHGRAIAMDSPGLVMLYAPEGHVRRLAVADPARRHVSLRIVLDAELEGKGEGWKAEWNSASKQTEIYVELPSGDQSGASRVLHFMPPANDS